MVRLKFTLRRSTNVELLYCDRNSDSVSFEMPEENLAQKLRSL